MGKPLKLWKILLPAAAIVLAAVGGMLLIKGRSGGESRSVEAKAPMIPGGLRTGIQVPDFKLPRLQGPEASIKEIKGKVILVNFWASWCQACVVEMPSIVRLWEAYKDKGFQVVAVNVDEDPDSVVPAMVKELGLTFPIYIDREQRLSELFDVSALPLTVILDQDQKVLMIETGEKDWNSTEIRSQLEKWLAS